MAPLQVIFTVTEPLEITGHFGKTLAPMEEVSVNACVVSGCAWHVPCYSAVTGGGYNLLGVWKKHSLLCTWHFSHCGDSPEDKHLDKYNPAQQVSAGLSREEPSVLQLPWEKQQQLF